MVYYTGYNIIFCELSDFLSVFFVFSVKSKVFKTFYNFITKYNKILYVVVLNLLIIMIKIGINMAEVILLLGIYSVRFDLVKYCLTITIELL